MPSTTVPIAKKEPQKAPTSEAKNKQQSTSSSSSGSISTASRQALHLGTQLSTTTTASQPIAPMPFSTAFLQQHRAAVAAAATPLTLSTLAPSTLDSHAVTTINNNNNNNAVHTPTIFLNRKLRAGKWIPEEETYAELLIELFEKGQFDPCKMGSTGCGHVVVENGSTLRSFLSQKLHCAPMRISKKFAGKGIGKMVYLSKLDSSSKNNRKENEGLLERVNVAQENFYEAVFPSSGDSIMVCCCCLCVCVVVLFLECVW